MEKIKSLKKLINKRNTVIAVILIAASAGIWYWLYPPLKPGEPSRSDKAAGQSQLEEWDSENRLDPNASSAEKYDYYKTRASALNGAGDYQGALDSFKLAEATGEPIGYSLYIEAALAYELMGDKAKARESYNKAITAAENQLEGEARTQTVTSIRNQMEAVR